MRHKFVQPAEQEGIPQNSDFSGPGVLLVPDSDGEANQIAVILDALLVYAERNPKYKDNWRRMGWRGCLIRIRERAERLWDEFWDAETLDLDKLMSGERTPPRDVDDALDLINFAAFMVRALRGETTRDGSWW
jgi:hypothetical protein